MLMGSERSAHASGRDVTAAVVAETQLDEVIAQACQDYCQGNRRSGRLRSVRVARLDRDHFAVLADVALRNHQYQDGPIGGFALYDYTVRATGKGTLTFSTCRLRIDEIVVHDDLIGLQSLAQSLVGTVHDIDGCRRFSFLH
ncbi:MAG TPA: hypothetical protein VGR62_18945 [Candidatus Binatia bacterium]|nr:hypothetical protein [Candidatus Binatia bacterium]